MSSSVAIMAKKLLERYRQDRNDAILDEIDSLLDTMTDFDNDPTPLFTPLPPRQDRLVTLDDSCTPVSSYGPGDHTAKKD